MKAGPTGFALEVEGATVAAASAALVILASGGAAALVMIGLGLFKRLLR